LGIVNEYLSIDRYNDVIANHLQNKDIENSFYSKAQLNKLVIKAKYRNIDGSNDLDSYRYKVYLLNDEYSIDDVILETLEIKRKDKNHIIYFSYNTLAYLFGQFDGNKLNWALKLIQMDKANKFIKSKENVNVAVVDNATHLYDNNGIRIPLNYKFHRKNVSPDVKVLPYSLLTSGEAVYDFTGSYNDEYLAYDPEVHHNLWIAGITSYHGLYVSGIIASKLTETGNREGVIGISGNDNVYVVPYSYFGGGWKTVEVINGNNKIIKTPEFISYDAAVNLNNCFEYIALDDKSEIQVVNISGGWDYDYLLNEAQIALEDLNMLKTLLQNRINVLQQNGIIIVAAAGNSSFNLNERKIYPACNDKVVAVGAADKDKKFVGVYNNSDRGSNYGDKVAILGPGQFYRENVTLNVNTYTSFSATSMAAPYVSGTLALLKAEARHWGMELNSDKLIECLIEGSKQINGNTRDPIGNDKPVLSLYGSIKYLYDNHILDKLPAEVVAATVTDTLNKELHYGKYFWNGEYYHLPKNIMFSYRNYPGEKSVVIRVGLTKPLSDAKLMLYDAQNQVIGTGISLSESASKKDDLSTAFELAGLKPDEIPYEVYVYEATINNNLMERVSSFGIFHPDMNQNPGREVTPANLNGIRDGAITRYPLLRGNKNPDGELFYLASF